MYIKVLQEARKIPGFLFSVQIAINMNQLLNKLYVQFLPARNHRLLAFLLA
jgi:hypothetical protein